MRPNGSAEALEMRRRIAVQLLRDGHGVREVARLVGVWPGSVSRWKHAYETDGEAGLASKRQPGRGRTPKLPYEQYPALEAILLDGPRTHGFDTDRWTRARIAAVIDREFGVAYTPQGVGEVLKRLGWTYQKPQTYSRKRDETAVARWRATTWPNLKN